MKKGDRPRMGFSPTLKSDPRDRQNNAHGIQNDAISSPLMIDAHGRATINVGGPLSSTPDGKLDVNVDHGLSVRTGSPKRIVVRTSDSVVVGLDGNLHARVRPLDIEGLEAYVKSIVATSAIDVSYAEPLISETAEFLFNDAGTDIVVSEIIY